MFINPAYTANMTDQQRAWFYAECQQASKDEIVGVLLAFFLGGFGIHRFYLGQTGAGVLYLIFCWTGIPTLVALIECFFMPGRIRAYNAMQAQTIAARILSNAPTVAPPLYHPAPPPPPALSVPRRCGSCGSSLDANSAFCPDCGASVAAKAS